MAYGAGLECRFGVTRPGFESLTLRTECTTWRGKPSDGRRHPFRERASGVSRLVGPSPIPSARAVSHSGRVRRL